MGALRLASLFVVVATAWGCGGSDDEGISGTGGTGGKATGGTGGKATGGTGAGGTSAGGTTAGGGAPNGGGSGGVAGSSSGGTAGAVSGGGTAGAVSGGGAPNGGGGAPNGGGGTGGGTACNQNQTGNPACDACLNANCCPQIQACEADPACVSLITCIQQHCANSPNVTVCALTNCGQWLSAASKAQAIQTCAGQSCPTQCPEL